MQIYIFFANSCLLSRDFLTLRLHSDEKTSDLRVMHSPPQGSYLMETTAN